MKKEEMKRILEEKITEASQMYKLMTEVFDDLCEIERVIILTLDDELYANGVFEISKGELNN